MQVVSASHPFRTETVDYEVPQGRSLSEILELVQPDPVLRQHAYIFIGDVLVPSRHWKYVKPKEGSLVSIRVVPQRGNTGKVVRTVLTIAVVAAAIAVSQGALAPTLGSAFASGTIGAGLAGAAVSAVGLLAVNALVPVRPPTIPSQSGISSSPTYSLEGARNRVAAWEPVPIVHGRHRVVPPYGALPFTRFSGQDQYLNLMFIWSLGRCTIDDLRIGQTSIDRFEGVRYDHDFGDILSADTTGFYSNDVDQDNFSIVLKQTSGFIRRTTSDNAEEISVDIVFPAGLVKISDKGGRRAREVEFSIRFRKVGDATWSAPSFTERTALGVSTQELSNETLVSIRYGRTSVVRIGLAWSTPDPDQYEVEIKRVTADSSDLQVSDQALWTALRRIKFSDPLNTGSTKITRTGMTIKATDQLNNVVDEANAVITSECLDWDKSSGTWIERATSNPASQFRYALQGPGIANPLPDSMIDLVKLQEWHEFCADRFYQFNMVWDFSSTVRELLNMIAAAGRASVAQVDGKWSVIIDEPQTIPVQHFSPRNTWNFRVEKAFADLPHGWRVQYLNRNNDWRRTEKRIFRSGFDSSNATKYERIEFPGVTGGDQLKELARHDLAVLELRPERYEFEVDFEHLVARRGSLILLTHDVLLVGLASGRIKELVTDMSGDITGIKVDERLEMTAGNSYGVSIRSVNDVKVTRQLQTVEGVHEEVSFATAIPAGGIEVGNLFGFGLLDSETFEAIVLRIERSTDHSARLSCVPHSQPEIENALTGEIADFEPGITPLIEIPEPTVTEVVTGESVLGRGAGDVLLARAAVRVQPLPQSGYLARVGTELQIQQRLTEAGDAFFNSEVVYRSPTEVMVGGVKEGETWDFRLRWVIPQGASEFTFLRQSDWTYTYGHEIVGTTSPPSGLQGLTISAFGGQAHLRWASPPELDVRFGGHIRFRHSPLFSGTTWSASTSIGQTVVARQLYANLPLLPGTYLARVYDAAGRPSTDIASVTTRQASVLAFAQAASLTEHPGFTGSKTDVVVVSNTLRLDAQKRLDDVADFDTIGDFDSLNSGVITSGTYDFASGFDLTTVTKVRLTVTIKSTSTILLDQFDERVNEVDDWEDWDMLDNQAESDVEVWVRWTDDDPGGSPTWSTYERLHSAEFEARGFDFQARLFTDDPTVTPVVEELSVVAETV